MFVSGLFRDRLNERLPDFENDVDAAVTGQLVFGFEVGVRKDLHWAKRVILNLAIGDLGDLFQDCLEGSGRAAMRSSRSLIEAAINMHTVCQSVDQADRYVAHLDLGPVLMTRTSPGHDRLDKKARSRYLHRLRTAGRSSEQRWLKAVEQYGNRFQRSWATQTLFDRANTVGRADLYEFYRLASLIAHGSSAGMAFGQGRVSDTDRLAMLTGPVPYLVPSALLIGVEAYLEILVALERDTPPIPVEVPWAMFQGVIDAWPILFTLTEDFMREMWQGVTGASPSMMCYAAFSRRGRRRWFVRTTYGGTKLLRAHPPTLVATKAERLERVIAGYRGDPTLPFSPGGWAAVALPGVAVSVDWGEGSIPMTAIPLAVENSTDGEWTIFTEDGSVTWSSTSDGAAGPSLRRS